MMAKPMKALELHYPMIQCDMKEKQTKKEVSNYSTRRHSGEFSIFFCCFIIYVCLYKPQCSPSLTHAFYGINKLLVSPREHHIFLRPSNPAYKIWRENPLEKQYSEKAS